MSNHVPLNLRSRVPQRLQSLLFRCKSLLTSQQQTEKALKVLQAANEELTRKRSVRLRREIKLLQESRPGLSRLLERNSKRDKPLLDDSAEKDTDCRGKWKTVADAESLRTARARREDLDTCRSMLCGVFLERTEQGQLRVRFDTSHFNVYFESYTLVLDWEEGKGSCEVKRHNLPHFIPLESLIEMNLRDGSAEDFIVSVQSYLQAYVARREQWQQFNTSLISEQATRGEIITGLMASEGCDVLRYECRRSEEEGYNVEILYDDLSSMEPTKVHVHDAATGAEDEAAVARYKAALAAPGGSLLGGHCAAFCVD